MSKVQERAPELYSCSLWSMFVAGWQLAKVPLCLLICSSAAFGASLVPNVSGKLIAIVAFAVLLLAMGGATLNSLQERVIDLTMERTSDRPLVRNTVSLRFAVVQATFLVVSGLVLLTVLGGSWLVVFLGTIALVIYNGVYTRLKQRTVLAILPGAVCGGLPPLIGWIAGGGAFVSYLSLLLFSLLFLWQVPHFCLILLRYRTDYLQAPQPSFLRFLSEKGVRQLSTIWIFALALVMMLFCISPAPVWQWQKVLLIVNALFLVGLAVYSLLLNVSVSYRVIFVSLNIILLNHMVILAMGFVLS